MGEPGRAPGQDQSQQGGQGQTEQANVDVARGQCRDAADEKAHDGQRAEGSLAVQIDAACAQVGGDADGTGQVPRLVQRGIPAACTTQCLAARGQGIPQQAQGPDQVVRLLPPN